MAHPAPAADLRHPRDKVADLVAGARATADRTEFSDNSIAATPFRRVAMFERGRVVGEPDWPVWVPTVLTD